MVSKNSYSIRRTLCRVLLPAVVLAFTGACDALDNALEVETPDRVPAEGLVTPETASLMTDGAIADFDCAYGAYVVLTGMLSQELLDATQTASRWPYEQRDVLPSDARYAIGSPGDEIDAPSPCEELAVYTPLSTARWSADNILQQLQQWTDEEVLEASGADRETLVATAAAYAGYSYLLLGEGFCSAAVDIGAELNPEDLFNLALERFETAENAASASGVDDMLNMARVGRARAYQDLGQGADAVAAAQTVPAGFVHYATASDASPRRRNRVYDESGVGDVGGKSASVGPRYRNVEWQGVPDPRVQAFDAETTYQLGTQVFLQEKYDSHSTPIPIASYVEAQLIIAEVEGGATARGIINQLHSAAGLPPFSGDDAATAAHVVEERRRELWLTGHRFNDIERLELPLDPAPGTEYRKGGVYGSTLCLPLPNIERFNNPEIRG